MLRGLDARGADEDLIMVKVADRPTLEGTTTVYLRSGVSSVVRDRQARVRETFEQLRNAGILEDVDVVEWPERARTPADTDVEAEAVAHYDEFVGLVGAGALEPFFEERSATGTDDRVVDLPAICIVHRDDGTPSALYPHWSDGTHHSIEDCTRALCAGDDIGNLRPS
ncbi:hypothetical protein BRD07_05155 [Halobacteriales archaeon QS_9_68_42]|nr:MAG: hypothetical protein BRC84_05495 [Halobacteriales archaeon QS_1_68_44]PSQ41570.1 MAG: hypothetical protein BRD07_05155 [Halobacteriales archaeon QS_9_68_42]